MAAAESGGKNSVEYIQHHLTNWTAGTGQINLDTILFSLLAGGLLVFFAWRVGRRVTSGPPGRLQNFLEVAVEFVNGQVRDAFPNKDPFVGPLALTVFLWVAAMNACDLIPVDLFPRIAQWVGMGFGLAPEDVHLRIVATADLSTTLALALSVFVMTMIYGMHARGIGGYFKRFLVHPYGIWMAPINLALSLVEEIAKPLSLALRLWGNFFAGELIFLLIALFGYAVWVAPGQAVLDWAWYWFETLEVILQAFIFMLLTAVYLAMAVAEDEH
ncbi:MAG TPA: F0F1 ATP synthase subunit A [Gammaproteobacteria bacterium]|nr:F0F1 ATP synthase subunit A [Gammaproteobacteria bacterium]